MVAPDSKQAYATFDAGAPSYAAYAQLLKMLLPSSGGLAVYDADGELLWCSGGFERPDLRELVRELKSHPSSQSNRGAVRQTAGGVSALVARLTDPAARELGFASIELGDGRVVGGSSMAASLTQPLLEALAAQLALERGAASAAHAAPPTPSDDGRLELMHAVAEIDCAAPGGIEHMLECGLDRLACISGAFCIPDQGLTVVAERDSNAPSSQLIESTRRYLLAWVQLNNKPMVVNRVDAEQARAPYKILSCPVQGSDGQASGIVALFRSADAPNFEPRDVRLVEFMARQAMAALREHHDGMTGLSSPAAFARAVTAHLERAPDGAGSLVCVDVAALTSINDAFGYEVGDEVINSVAELIRRKLAIGEQAVRLVGGRFVLLLPERAASAAVALSRELAGAAAALGYRSKGRPVAVALRTGVATRPADGSKSRHWIAAAERALQETEAQRR